MSSVSENATPAASAVSRLDVLYVTEPCEAVCAERFTEALHVVDNVQKLCVAMEKEVVGAKSEAATGGVSRKYTEQELVSAALALCTFHDLVMEKRKAGAPANTKKPRGKPRGKPRCHVGLKVAVLWVPKDFPPDATPERSDLVYYNGEVVKHIPSRKSGTHLVLYEDGMQRWHKRDSLFKFL